MEYIAVYGLDTSDLSEKVNKLIKDGWKPFGSLSCAMATAENEGIYYQYSQAMIKE